ncbi:MAG: hypothetical protein IT186_13305 [Acidobacteria bacterium]|nr:hypothetical protein [Acidobacteriota bacterium]
MQTPVRSVAGRYVCYGVLALLGSGGAPGADILCAAEPPPAGEAAPAPEMKRALPVDQDPGPPPLPPDSAIESPEGAPPVEPEYWGNVDRPIQHDPAEADDPDFAWRKTWRESPQWGGRMGYVDAAGNLKITLTYDPSTPWVTVAKKVASFQLMDWRLAVLTKEGRLLFQEGELREPFREIDRDVKAFQMTLTQIGMLHADGTLRIKESGFATRTVAEGVKAFQVTFDGRVGILGNDGSLYHHHGGMITPESARLVARDVSSFQIEREWLLFVQNKEGVRRLMVAREAMEDAFHTLSEPVAVTRNPGDFESEVEVDFGDFKKPSHLRLAVAMDGALQLFEGNEPGLKAAGSLSPGFSVASVNWTEGILAASGTRGEVGVAFRQNGAVGEFQVLGKAEEFALSVGGTVLVARDGKHLGLLEPVREPAPVARTSETEPAAVVLPSPVPRYAADSERQLLVASTSRDGGSIGLSSLRSSFTRRPISLNGAATGSAGAVRFVEPEAPPFPAPGAIVLGLPSSEPAAGSAAEKE